MDFKRIKLATENKTIDSLRNDYFKQLEVNGVPTLALETHKTNINRILELDIDKLNDEDIKTLRDFEAYLKIVKKVGKKARIVKTLQEYLAVLKKLGFNVEEDTSRNRFTKEDFEAYQKEEITIVGADTFQGSPRYAFICSLDNTVRYIHPSIIEIIN